MSVSQKLTSDKGKILENMVFIHLRHHTNRIYYGKTPSNKEIDFITASPGVMISEQTPFQLWQVCYEMGNTSTFKRETEALWEAMEQYYISSSTIITYQTETRLEKDNMSIEVVPAWKFLLSELS